ncbi:MAG: hypothetical protein K0Q99_1256, partial [Clostridia bacterium]|nr:hypothetical protein [Clostridia bacterium]
MSKYLNSSVFRKSFLFYNEVIKMSVESVRKQF